MYTSENDKSRVSLSDFFEEELRDEVRCLTRLSQKDNIILTSARLPLDLKHLPAKVISLVFASNVVLISRSVFDNSPSCCQASTVNQCYPPMPESGVVPEDDDASEETEDEQHILEDSDAQGDEAPKDEARIKSMRRMKINEDLLATAESSPSGREDDADSTPSPASSRRTSPPSITKGSTGLFADEDDLEL
jgi:hypothetical protein